MKNLRPELALISEWIKPGSRVLDLGCGDGTLLVSLREEQQVSGYGLEIDINNVIKCIEAGLDVVQCDLDEGLSGYFDDNSFDYVIMTETIQAVTYPGRLLNEMLRVGREGIVAFPNFAYWRCRLQILLQGKMPTSEALPYSWYDTPNIHLCTFEDFENFCQEKQIEILDRTVVDHAHRPSFWMTLAPNFLGEIALYRFRRMTP